MGLVFHLFACHVRIKGLFEGGAHDESDKIYLNTVNYTTIFCFSQSIQSVCQNFMLLKNGERIGVIPPPPAAAQAASNGCLNSVILRLGADLLTGFLLKVEPPGLGKKRKFNSTKKPVWFSRRAFSQKSGNAICLTWLSDSHPARPGILRCRGSRGRAPPCCRGCRRRGPWSSCRFPRFRCTRLPARGRSR